MSYSLFRGQMVLFIIPDFLTPNIHYSFSFKPLYSLFIIQLPAPIRKAIGLLCFAVQRNISSPQQEMYRHVLLLLSLMTFKMPANDSGLRDTCFSTKYRSDTRSARALALPSSTTCKASIFSLFPQKQNLLTGYDNQPLAVQKQIGNILSYENISFLF